MRCATAEGTARSLIVITADKKTGRQAVIRYNGYKCPLTTLTTTKVQFIFELPTSY